MILVDAGPLVALIDADDEHHASCVAAFKKVREPLGSVWPALAEAMYLLGDLPKGQEALWEMLVRGAVHLIPLGIADVSRMRELMRKYADRPMDLADAALVRVADATRVGILDITQIAGMGPVEHDRSADITDLKPPGMVQRRRIVELVVVMVGEKIHIVAASLIQDVAEGDRKIRLSERLDNILGDS